MERCPHCATVPRQGFYVCAKHPGFEGRVVVLCEYQGKITHIAVIENQRLDWKEVV